MGDVEVVAAVVGVVVGVEGVEAAVARGCDIFARP